MSDLSEREFRRILLIKPSSVGDVLHAVPVLWGLRQRYPRARISWLIANSCAPLIKGHPAVDEIILFDRRHYGRLGRNRAATRDFVRFIRRLHARRFDLVVDLQGLFRSGFFALASGASVRIGFGRARECGWIFYTDRIPPINGEAHAVERNVRVAELLGFAGAALDFSIPVRPEARATVRALLAAEGIDANDDYLAVAPGARWETKRWGAARFSAAIDLFHEACGARGVLLGSTEDAALCAQVAEQARHRPVNLAGRTAPGEWVAAVAESRVVLGNDSGTKDIAVATGRGLVTIFGPTNPVRTGAYGREEAVVRRELPCSPCYLRKLAKCRHEHRCMEQVTAQEVIERVMREWRRARAYNDQ